MQPGIFNTWKIDQQFSVVRHGERTIRQYLARCEKLLFHLLCIVFFTRQQILDGKSGSVTQIGECITQQLQCRNSWIVDVVIGPNTLGQILHMLQPDVVQCLIILCDFVGFVFR